MVHIQFFLSFFYLDFLIHVLHFFDILRDNATLTMLILSLLPFNFCN